jgi:hypothetical protein
MVGHALRAAWLMAKPEYVLDARDPADYLLFGYFQTGEIVGELSACRGDAKGTATAQMRRPGVVVLSASYESGWAAIVNGGQRPTRMVGSALVAVEVPVEAAHITFACGRCEDHLIRLALSGLAVAAFAVVPICMRRARRKRRSADE